MEDLTARWRDEAAGLGWTAADLNAGTRHIEHADR
jgi:hypothetical protein